MLLIKTVGVLSCAALFACVAPHERYADEIAGIDATLTTLDSALLVFGQVDADEVTRVFKVLNNDLRAAQLNLEQGEVDEETARLFAEYTRARRLIKDFPQRMRTFPAEIERTRLQLNGLKDALQNGASRDALGNKITPEYVEKNYNTEITLAKGLTEELLNTVDYADRSTAMFYELEPKVREQFTQWKNQ